MKKRKKYKTLSLLLPEDVANFYRKFAKLMNTTPSTVIRTVVMIEAVKILEQKKSAKRSKAV